MILCKVPPKSLEPGMLSFGYSENIIILEHIIQRAGQEKYQKIGKNNANTT